MLKQFIHPQQLQVINSARRGEEGQFFNDKLAELKKLIAEMPVTYSQDGVKDPIVYLHYFNASSDWYITEKDMEDQQMQAYGYVILNGNEPEAGYISLVEMMSSRRCVEIDLYFTPKPISQIPKLAEHFTPEDHEPEPEPTPEDPKNDSHPITTSIIDQHQAIKDTLPKDTILLMKLGDFYEILGDDAITAAKLMNIVLTKRNNVPMCGFPHHSTDLYIKHLLEKGYRLALADRLPDHTPLKPKGFAITRYINPPTSEPQNIITFPNSQASSLLTRFPLLATIANRE